ncbi:MAG: glycosyltransferase [Vicinamibacteria bacterium]|nr:glycosyltransferase [Vicinamibacteria bacterium]
MSDRSRVSVVVPAFNEEKSVADVVARIGSESGWREVLVIDDGSSDQTAAAALGAGARVVRHPYNKGNGAAVKTGVREARGDVVLLMDADGQHDARDIDALLAKMETHDMVIGSRKACDQPPLRALGNFVFRALASWLTGRPIPDLTSGFRAVDREKMLSLLNLLPNGFSYPTTSCLAFLKAGYNVTFVPIKAHRRVGASKIRPLRDGVLFLLIIFKIITIYSPLKIFFPIATFSFLAGAGYGLWNVIVHHKIPMGAALLIQLAVIVFLIGLLSEQIAAWQERR